MAFSFESLRDPALLIWRIGLGGMYMLHGAPKLSGGPEKWAKIGGAMKHLGITGGEQYWGLAAALSEGLGGLLLVVGLLTRPASATLVFTMFVAAMMHLRSGDGIMDASHAIENAFSFLALFAFGPGRFSLDARWRQVR